MYEKCSLTCDDEVEGERGRNLIYGQDQAQARLHKAA